MINLNCVFKIWLTAFLATSGAWVVLESGAKAQSAGTITINSGNIGITQNGTVATDSITTNRSDISGNPTNSVSNGGNISITATAGTLTLVKIPEPSFVGGILAVAGAAAVSRLKHKRK
ncbi:hypothetical protein NIES4071_105790 (plasmid) [Calothrix sp. NIES-4071]|nr:hypothetical protein NIES4071_105790 [Calothrix sp. NIES-4071]BAZ64997.1 hypothetical protein NIES4105_107300 [Calothrix sp. NIES-4105]